MNKSTKDGLRQMKGCGTNFTGFLSAFVNTTSREDALSQLLSLKMKGTDLDTYILTFDNLQLKAGWEKDAQGTLLLFCRGLTNLLCRVIFERVVL